MPREPLVLPHRLHRLEHMRVVAVSAALRPQLPTRLRRPEQAPEECVVVRYPVEHRVREHPVHLLRQREVRQARPHRRHPPAGGRVLTPLRKLLRQRVHHLLRRVERVHPPPRQFLQQVERHRPRPAPRVEHRLVPRKLQPLDYRLRPPPHRLPDPLINLRIPVRIRQGVLPFHLARTPEPVILSEAKNLVGHVLRCQRKTDAGPNPNRDMRGPW